MVEIAPLPSGFPPPLDADKLPVETSHPMEAWAEPRPAFEQTVRRVLPGGGYSDISPAALARFEAEAEWRQSLPPVLHAGEIARQRREREEAAEAERKAHNPEAVLRAAHILRAEALAEVERLAPLVTRARQLVEDLERRQQEHAAVVVGAEEAAAARLIEALAAGSEAPPAPPLDVVPAAALAHELATAKGALAELERQATAAADRLARCTAGVSRCAIAVLIDRAAAAANAIVEAEAEWRRSRADLAALSSLLTAEGRRLNGAPPNLPAPISRALYPPDPVLTGADRRLELTDWRARYAELCAAPEAQSE
jgi:hypothetical protein